MARYNAKESEKHWQQEWDARALFATPLRSDKPKYYVLEMFPYPSGRIHMGHTRNYTMGDVIARFRRAQGYNVLHPMGWDAFGLPAENAARDKGVSPRDWTYENIAAMRAQLKMMGLSIDWSREFATCDPEYYHQQQKLFLDFYKAGFVYRSEADVNWDPVDMTVLANEQVIDGRGWRSGAIVERRKLSQWFFKITGFADELLAGLDTLDRWPEKVRTMQKNWIGRSEGLRFQFKLSNNTGLDVFTTRPDTLFGASFVALSPDHPLAQELAAQDKKLEAFIAECRMTGTAEAEIEKAEKLGFDTGLTAAHPFDPRIGVIGRRHSCRRNTRSPSTHTQAFIPHAIASRSAPSHATQLTADTHTSRGRSTTGKCASCLMHKIPIGCNETISTGNKSQTTQFLRNGNGIDGRCRFGRLGTQSPQCRRGGTSQTYRFTPIRNDVD